jgi:hypothetical protein
MRGIGVLIAVACAVISAGPGVAAAAQPAESAFLYMGSQRGEYVGQGSRWSYTHANARFEAGYYPAHDPSSISIEIDDPSDARNPWSVELAAPAGRKLARGRYLDAERAPFREPGFPGIDVSGDARGCNKISGRFVVKVAEFTPSGDVVRFLATFVQYCEGYLTALYGTVGIGVPPPASFPKPPPFVPATLTLRSDPADYVGQGRTFSYSNGVDAVFQTGRGPSGVYIHVLPYAGLPWFVDLAAPGRRPPPPGAYPDAMRNPFEPPGVPGLDVSGEGRGCNELSGRFDVAEAEYDRHGEVRRLLARFVQHCEHAAPALRGEVQVGSPVRAILRVLPPRAGAMLTARLRVHGGGRGVRIRRVRCVARVEGRTLARIERMASGRRARCAWRLPHSASGKVVRGSVRVRAGGRAITRRFRALVR